MGANLRLNNTTLFAKQVHNSFEQPEPFVPGQPTDMAIPIRLDLYQFFRSNARDAFELAKGLSGTSSRPTEIALRAVPTIDTPLGAITYPGSITVVRRTVGGP